MMQLFSMLELKGPMENFTQMVDEFLLSLELESLWVKLSEWHMREWIRLPLKEYNIVRILDIGLLNVRGFDDEDKASVLAICRVREHSRKFEVRLTSRNSKRLRKRPFQEKSKI
mmetsp:Transcript_9148/g.13726  ORF Transcript_9148/g.13726 Transcript_9148/m.13726 type:complete len:114 (-) Transcript_9148:58-399(-)